MKEVEVEGERGRMREGSSSTTRTHRNVRFQTPQRHLAVHIWYLHNFGTINIYDHKIGGLMKTLMLLEALCSSKELVHCRSEDFQLRESNCVSAHPASDYIRCLDVCLTLSIAFMGC